MTELLSGMAAGVANHLWQSTAFAAVVWVTTLLLRKNAARVRYGLWVAASAKFLVPFSLLIALGGMLPRPQHTVVTMPVYSAVDEVGLPFSDVETVPVETPTHAAMRPRHEWGTQIAVGLAGVWVCGVVVVLGIWCGGWRKVRRTLWRAVAASEGREVEILQRVQARVGGRRVRLVLSREWMEPGMFGIWRPVLIWPEGLSARLDDEHVEAIVAHELMHARRRDNLTAALHMLVEAAFWFHPLVWWMERRMVEERERACDEAVVEMGSRPGVYAKSLLKAVRFCVESPLVCVAGVTGADLAGRVRSIMTLRLKKLGVAGKVALAALALAAIAGPLAFGVVRMIPMYGQVLHATGPLPSFEVATIKPTSKDETRSGMGVTDGGRGFRTTNATARDLIQEAYGLKSTDQILGATGWMTTEHFDIEARMDDAQADRLKSLPMDEKIDQVRLMVQSLLAERFGLKLHESTRDSSFFALEVAKGGAKLKPTAMAAADPKGINAPHPAVALVRWEGPGKIQATGVGLPTLADELSRMPELGSEGGFTMGVLVVDKTGLTGMYDWTLNWSPDNGIGGKTENGDAPPLYTALQEQLGLKLVKEKGPVAVLEIDHIEKPVLDSADAGAKSGVIANAVAAGQRLLGSLVPVALVQPAQASSAASAARGEYGVWLDQDARWLITPEERTAFLALTNDQERDDYIQKFWERKGSAAGMSGSAYKAAIYARFAYANEHFASTRAGWSTDRGHIYVVFGKPDEVKAQPADGMETWVYHYVAGVGDNVTLKFVKGPGAADYRLMTPYPGGIASHMLGASQAGQASVNGMEVLGQAYMLPVAMAHTQATGSVAQGSLQQFDAATIKPRPPAGGIPIAGFLGYPGGRITYTGNAQKLIEYAYGLEDYQIAGGPDWITSDKFDIAAIPPDNSPSRKIAIRNAEPTTEQRRELQSLLRDRFGLQCHMETKEGEVYVLIRGTKPLQLKLTELPDTDPRAIVFGMLGGIEQRNGGGAAGKPTPNGPISFPDGAPVALQGTNTTADYLALRMSHFLQLPVLNQTGIEGSYDFDVPAADALNQDMADVVLSLVDRLGLKIKRGRNAVQTLVIDHVERPSEN